MQTWHCTNRERHLPHTWYYRKDGCRYRCDGQPRTEEQPCKSTVT